MKNKIRTIFRVHFIIIPPDVCDSLTSSLLEFPTFESDVNFYYTHYMLIHILDCLAKTIVLRTINHLNYNVSFILYRSNVQVNITQYKVNSIV